MSYDDESFGDKFKRKFSADPFVPIGCALTAGILASGLGNFTKIGNRQNAIKKFANGCDKFIVVGSKNSSNSNRLVEVAINAGCADSILLDSKDDLDLELYNDANIIGISSGASVPESLVIGIIEKFKSKYEIEVKEFELEKETVAFNLPQSVRK